MREKSIENKIKQTLSTLMRNGKPIWYFKHAAGVAMKVGIPDIIACIEGIFVGIEVKSTIGRQSEAQIVCENNINRALGEYWLVDSHEEFLDKINKLRGRYENNI